MAEAMDKKAQYLLNRQSYRNGERYLVKTRRAMLQTLLTYVLEHRQQAMTALYNDLNKSEFEAMATEFVPLVTALKYMIRHLRQFAAARNCGVSMLNFPASGHLVPEPYGQILIAATWNYPLLLAVEPVVGAIAAGNKVVLKLSPLAKHTSQWVKTAMAECFTPDQLIVIDDEYTLDEVLSWQFDLMFFTGGMETGKKVAKMAAEHLTPTVLELGGKNPCIVDASADLKIAAKRIVWGKFTNAGQTCLAPDFLLVETSVKEKLLQHIRTAITDFYGIHPVDHPDYPRIVNDHHYERLCALMTGGRLVAGGEKNPERCAIAPTVIDNVDWSDPLMAREIFGPLLPVFEFVNFEEAVQRVRELPKPLALYYFGKSTVRQELLSRTTSSGAFTVNDVVTHFVNETMPFGGVGPSGMGSYHGKYSFDAFTHYKPVMKQLAWLDFPARYPTFAAVGLRILKLMVK